MGSVSQVQRVLNAHFSKYKLFSKVDVICYKKQFSKVRLYYVDTCVASTSSKCRIRLRCELGPSLYAVTKLSS